MNTKYEDINAKKITEQIQSELKGIPELDIRIKYLRIQLNSVAK